MMPFTVFIPQEYDKNIANYIQFSAAGYTNDEDKVIRMINSGGARLSAEQVEQFYAAVDKAATMYDNYSQQEISVGGLIATEEAAEHLRQRWSLMRDQCRDYLATRLEGKQEATHES